MPGSYEKAHAVLSIGVAAGLHPTWLSGTLMLPKYFIPFDMQNMTMLLSNAYTSKNHLLDVLGDVLSLQNQELLDAINYYYQSENPSKASEHTTALQREDFHTAHLLQVNGLFNPSILPNSIEIIMEPMNLAN